MESKFEFEDWPEGTSPTCDSWNTLTTGAGAAVEAAITSAIKEVEV